MPRPPQQMVVSPELDGASLAAAVHSLFGLSWSKARDWIGAGKFSVNGAGCTEARVLVRGGDRLALDVDARRPPTLVDRIEEAIVFLDEHLVVVNKPPGLSTVPFEDERDTLDRLLRRCLARRDRRAGGAHRSSRGPSLHVVHRIDRETSGLLVFARTYMAKTHVALQLREHTVHRRYLAIAHGEVQSQTVSSHLLADRGDGRRGSRERSARGATPGDRGSERAGARLEREGPRRRSSGEGRIAVTHVEVLERLRGATLLACRLETGRTHQIRIHLGEIGHPVLGERVYAGDLVDAVSIAPRLMLHAAELGLVHPATGKPVRWEQPMPADMAEVLDRLRG